MHILLYFSSSIVYTSNKISALPCAKQKKKKETLFLLPDIHYTFFHRCATIIIYPRASDERNQRERHSNRNYLFARSFVPLRSLGRCSIRNISSASLLRNAHPLPPVSLGEQRAGVHLLILTRSNCQFALCYPAVLSKQYAPLAACLRINREHAPLFHPREAIPPPLPLSLVQSSRSKAFKVISVNWREKKLAHCRRWFSTIRQGLVSTVGKVLSTRFEIAEPVTESVTWKLRCLCSGMMDLMG